MTNAQRWSAVLRRERGASFVYAVRTTRIFCRPSCPSRRPREENVLFFEAPATAEAAGFRPCLRCEPTKAEPRAGLVADICRFLEANRERRVPLSEISEFAGLSPFHLQRVFRSELGVSPRQYLQALQQRESAPGDAVTYATLDSPLGRTLIAETRKGICAVAFGDDDEQLVAFLRNEMPFATLQPGIPSEAAEAVVSHIGAALPDLPLDIQGTAFQQKVWTALRNIPRGDTRTYKDLAVAIGLPTGARAVARACATNRIALLIPCHRIVPAGGSTGGYRWGSGRKLELLNRESA